MRRRTGNCAPIRHSDDSDNESVEEIENYEEVEQ